MNTENPRNLGDVAQGWVLYDGDCSLCTDAAQRLAPTLHRHHFDVAPLQSAWVRQQLGLRPDQPLTEMKLLTANGAVYSGADALVQIARNIWWSWPWFAVSRIPGAMPVLHTIYRRIADNRNC